MVDLYVPLVYEVGAWLKIDDVKLEALFGRLQAYGGLVDGVGQAGDNNISKFGEDVWGKYKSGIKYRMEG